MAYTVLSQNNSVTTLEDDQGNVIHIPSVASLAKSTDYTILKVKNSTATLEDGDGNTYRDVPCVVVLADDSSSYTPIAQNNTKATLESSDNNIIHIPSKVVLASSTDFTIVKVNNSTATLEDGSGNIIRDVPCVSMLADESYSITKVNNSTATLSNDGKTIRDVPCIVILAKTSGAVEVIIKGTSPLNLPDAIANSLSYVKAFGGTEQSNLPVGYIQRQFIYMMDGSYLLTDIVPSSDMRIEMDFQTTSILNCRYLGARNSAVAGNGLQLGVESSKFVVDGFQERYQTGQTPTANTRYKFVYNDGAFSMYQGGTLISSHTFTPDQTTTAKMVINAINTAGTISGNTAGIYLYSFKVWNAQGELVADYVPAVQKGTVPVVGFYDTVSGTFKTATAGTFAAGPEAVPTPDVPMNIVSNNGVLKYTPNLLDMSEENIVLGKYINNSGGVADDTKNFYNSKYIPVVAGETYTWSTSSSVNYFSVMEYDSGYVFKNRTLFSNAGTSGSITLGADTAFVLIGSNIDGTIVTRAKINAIDWQFEKGSSATAYTPYVEGGIYADGTVETINVHGKNLIDVADFSLPNNSSSSALWTGSITGPLRLSVDKSQVTSVGAPSTRFLILVVNGNTTYVDYNDSSSVEINGTLTSIRCYNSLAFAKVVGKISLQLERGTTTTAYEPYYDGGTATAEMLLKVGDYQDVQNIIDGVVTRNVGVKVLDGTESWTITVISGHRVFTVIKTDIGTSSTVLPAGSLNMICTHFIPHTNSGYTDGDVWAGSTGVNFVKDNFSTVTEWTNWVKAQYNAGTPVIVVYPLATPTTESVTGQTLQVQDGDNILEITQASLDNLELEAQYQAAVSLTIEEVENANLDNNVEVTIS